jgi:hypothetical protein
LTATLSTGPGGIFGKVTWVASNASACTASGAWSGGKRVSGTEVSPNPRQDADYVLTCHGRQGSTRAVARLSGGLDDSAVKFPLHVEAGRRYLVDANGKPFLLHGDTAWSLIAQPTDAEVDQYLDDRQARGFNTLIVNLIEHKFADNAPSNAQGDLPFLTPGDFSTPNEAYFAHVDSVLTRAAQKGFLVLLVPVYLGYDGGDQGWYQEMVANGTTKLREYGRFLGQRYQHYNNILWIHGGDYNPPDRSLTEAIAAGIREFDADTLGSAHCIRETAAIDYWGGEPWLQVNTIYTSNPVYAVALTQYQRPEQMPFFLIEATYENGTQQSPPLRVRTQSYHALLSGAAGQVFGNNPIWHFSGPGLYPAPYTWQQSLGLIGSQAMTHLWNLMSTHEWWRLAPDLNNTTLTAGLGTDYDRAVAALADNRSFAIVYLPTARYISVDLGRLTGPSVRATWYDPVSGNYTGDESARVPATGPHVFRPPSSRDSEDSDWVLVLESIVKRSVMTETKPCRHSAVGSRVRRVIETLA